MFDMKNLDQLKKLDENVHDTMKGHSGLLIRRRLRQELLTAYKNN